MLVEQDLSEFLRSTFRSIWSLELLFLTADDPKRCWCNAELVAALRASELVVQQGVDDLSAAALVVPEPGQCIRYSPVSAQLHQQVMAARTLYMRSPHVVRRMIVRAQQGSITAFADAFKLRTD